MFGAKNGWERADHFDPGRPWRRAGADQREYGWTRPPWFRRVAEEHKAIRERVGMIDMTSFGKIEVQGPGALPLLERVCVQPRSTARSGASSTRSAATAAAGSSPT